MKRKRMNRIVERDEQRKLPTIDDFFASGEVLSEDFASELVDKIIFSRYPGSKQGGAAALRAFLTNGDNMDVLKQSGTIGAILDTLHRMSIKDNARSNQR